MIKKGITPYVMILIIGFIVYAGASTLMGLPLFTRSKQVVFIHPLQTTKEDQLLPAFNLLLADSLTNVNTGNIPEGKPIVLFYFSPYCPFCKIEIKEIVNNIYQLRNIQFYVFTPYSFNEMKGFFDEFELSKYANISTGIDTNLFFGRYFNTIRTPYIAIYGKDKRLNGAFTGNISSQQIIAVSKM